MSPLCIGIGHRDFLYIRLFFWVEMLAKSGKNSAKKVTTMVLHSVILMIKSSANKTRLDSFPKLHFSMDLNSLYVKGGSIHTTKTSSSGEEVFSQTLLTFLLHRSSCFLLLYSSWPHLRQEPKLEFLSRIHSEQLGTQVTSECVEVVAVALSWKIQDPLMSHRVTVCDSSP